MFSARGNNLVARSRPVSLAPRWSFWRTPSPPEPVQDRLLPRLFGKLTPTQLLPHIFGVPPPKTPTTVLYEQWFHSARPVLCISIDPNALASVAPPQGNQAPKWARVSGEQRIPSIMFPGSPKLEEGPAVSLDAVRFGVLFTAENLPYIHVNFGKEEDNSQLLWHGLPAIQVLPNVLKTEIARYIPDPNCDKHAFTWFLWVMRVLAPALISRATVRDDPKWMKEHTMSIVHKCAIRAQYIISRYPPISSSSSFPPPSLIHTHIKPVE